MFTEPEIRREAEEHALMILQRLLHDRDNFQPSPKTYWAVTERVLALVERLRLVCTPQNHVLATLGFLRMQDL